MHPPRRKNRPDITNELWEDQASVAESRHNQHDYYSTPVHLASSGSTGYRSFLSVDSIDAPLAGTQYHSVDQGNATSKFVRSSMNVIPRTEKLYKEINMPFSLIVRPFAPLLETEEPISAVVFPDVKRSGQSYRCRKCGTYFNPNVKISQQKYYFCNVCTTKNRWPLMNYELGDLPDEQTRCPKLKKGVFDINIPASKDPVEEKWHYHIIIIDKSREGHLFEYPSHVAQSLSLIMRGSSGVEPKPRLKIALLLCDEVVQYFKFLKKSKECSFHLLDSGTDAGVVVPDMFVNCNKAAAYVKLIKTAIKGLKYREKQSAQGPCFYEALGIAANCLNTVKGGKITTLLSRKPHNHFNSSAINLWVTNLNDLSIVTKHLSLSKKNEKGRSSLKSAINCQRIFSAGISVDVFMVGKTSETFEEICSLVYATKGKYMRWTNFSKVRDSANVERELFNSIWGVIGYLCEIKISCSPALEVEQYNGFDDEQLSKRRKKPFSYDIKVPALGEPFSLTTTMNYCGDICSEDCFFQMSVAYYDVAGTRKVRVINYSLPVTSSIGRVFDYMELDGMVGALLHHGLVLSLDSSPLKCRGELHTVVSKMLQNYESIYKKRVTDTMKKNWIEPNGVLHPALLCHILVYVWSISKRKSFRNKDLVREDERIADRLNLQFMPMERLTFLLYPALIDLGALKADECMRIKHKSNVHGFIKLPLFKQVSFSCLRKSVYMLCNGETIFVYIHPQADPRLINDLFGDRVNCSATFELLIDRFPEIDTLVSHQARNLADYFHRSIIGNPGPATITVTSVKQPDYHSFREALVEDTFPLQINDAYSSYSQYVQSVQNIISRQRPKIKPVPIEKQIFSQTDPPLFVEEVDGRTRLIFAAKSKIRSIRDTISQELGALFFSIL